MAKITSIPRRRRLPVSRGNYMVDVCRGVLRVRKWPRKRGTPKSALQRWWNDWFRQGNLLAKYADAASQTRAIEITAGSGMYPRDYLLKAMRGRLYVWRDQFGWVWHSMAARGDISQSLDVLGQTIGDLLVRGKTYWAPAAGGVLGDVVTHRGPADPPEWLAPAGGGGVTQEQLPGTPISPDNTVAAYEFDVSAYTSVNFVLDAIGFAASDRPMFRFSTDNGATYRNGATDYMRAFIDKATNGIAGKTEINATHLNAASGQQVHFNFYNLRVGQCGWLGVGGTTSALAKSLGGFATFAGPITDIKLYSNAGNNMNAGTIRVVGSR